ncbi:MAG: DUF4870 domain-containing protein [Chloroflexota bacterium]|nr:DUF4870 domain-containing protein [Chloroflexota bacterium]
MTENISTGKGAQVNLPIEGYENLTVREVVPLLPELDRDGLQAIRDYEAAHSNRTTILRAVDKRMGDLDTATDEVKVDGIDSDVSSDSPNQRTESVEKTAESLPEETPTLTDRLVGTTEYDPAASNDDKVMAALSYTAQLLPVFGLLLPIIILISETSNKRPFQRYHAVQSLVLSLILWGLQSIMWIIVIPILTASIICLPFLCVLLPVMIFLWLLPLYYAILAYEGKKFSIPGLTQFLEDQGWLNV